MRRMRQETQRRLRRTPGKKQRRRAVYHLRFASRAGQETLRTLPGEITGGYAANSRTTGAETGFPAAYGVSPAYRAAGGATGLLRGLYGVL